MLTKPRRAVRSELVLAHAPEYVDKRLAEWEQVERAKASERPAKKLRKLAKKLNERNQTAYASVDFTNEHTVDCALLAAGVTLQCVDAVVAGRAHSSAALVRPPGHHAECGCAMGFCHFNNVAVAAAREVARDPKARVRVALLLLLLPHYCRCTTTTTATSSTTTTTTTN